MVDLMLSILPHTHKRAKGHMETFRDDRYVYYLDCGNGMMGVCIGPNSSTCTH